jgi:hypothetical protein
MTGGVNDDKTFVIVPQYFNFLDILTHGVSGKKNPDSITSKNSQDEPDANGSPPPELK